MNNENIPSVRLSIEVFAQIYRETRRSTLGTKHLRVYRLKPSYVKAYDLEMNRRAAKRSKPKEIVLADGVSESTS